MQSHEVASTSMSHHQQQQQQMNNNSQGQQNGGVTTGTAAPNSPGSAGRQQISGGRFDFEDGGTYCGGWEEGKAHGHGVCTGPKHQGAYSGAWNYGFEVSGVYIWPSGSSFEGQWQNGRRHGLGVETRGRWIYRGEWTGGAKGRYGVRQSVTSTARYEGTWAGGFQDGYGSETYADGGTYQGQWLSGKRHGYGVRQSAPFGLASHYRPKAIQTSMTSLRSNEGEKNVDPADKRNHRIDDVRGGFVLKARSDEAPARRNSLVEKTKKGLLSGLKIRKQRSTGDLEKRGTGASGSIRSTVSTASWISTGSSQSGMTTKSMHTDSNASFTVDEEQLDPSVTETYMGEWKHDKRDGYGISERSDGLRYEGEWHNNKKHGYGVTTFRDSTKEEGKYKCNVLITSQKKKHVFLIRSAKFRERIEAAVSSAQRASKYALQKADIAISRTATARSKAELADVISDQARMDSDLAVSTAREFAPDFKPSVLERFERLRNRERPRPPTEPPGKLELMSSPKSMSPETIKSPSSSAMGTTRAPSVAPVVQPQSQAAFRRQSFQQHQQQTIDYSQMNNVSNIQYSQPHSLNSSLATGQGDYMSGGQSMYQQQQPQTQPNSSYMNQFSNHQIPNTQMNYTPSQNPYNSTSIQQQQQQQQLQQQQQVYSMSSNMSTASGQSFGKMNSVPYSQPQSQAVYGMAQNQPNYYNMSDQQLVQQQPLQDYSTSVQSGSGMPMRRSSQMQNEGQRPMLGSHAQPSSIDHFDHYKRPPSRDSSVDRYTRAASRLGGGFGSRQPSIDRTLPPAPASETPERSVRAGSAFRQMGPAPAPTTSGNGTVMTGSGASRSGTPVYQVPMAQPVYSSPNQPFEDVLLRQRTLGQDIVPSPAQPKRTESLFIGAKAAPPATGGGGGGKGLKDWFSRQQLVMLVLVVNIALAIMFFKMLT
ncbi:junctophilin-1 isoform X2 [Lutzomyia longipalpis]|uniref:junctophilin-1 isoform X2 n=1 Tax=Lutzomyia longipalpis TaxID=7200 RepID=UPI002483BC0E|nr:junctophilin-1 isoform X2 [Lutzomyia longipalpis]XP_055682026.1 junctophilin-1 isoform X2 [Lutzomyia longipalpis]XP_055682027.1 junctophilin-1 isoform X2 [Lutzomyia longipalpis]XP_055682028.1 junctophilin-1 isoform X2 [Lutzomyia longipalpis]XP_055682029.1 junctophilin-1 isoform X2 [Lutzomyia longipalpis]XP_055682030.1 junctophilin-1 isoform X2 [Lutzomyia longipalpis]XP_055682031.1 junctophilin-1 isoform X2 [Lutzomyia longipalpis]XP_055682032.1 junctophilin-1 isoform X2 [Lutzomyia longipal